MEDEYQYDEDEDFSLAQAISFQQQLQEQYSSNNLSRESGSDSATKVPDAKKRKIKQDAYFSDEESEQD